MDFIVVLPREFVMSQITAFLSRRALAAAVMIAVAAAAVPAQGAPAEPLVSAQWLKDR